MSVHGFLVYSETGVISGRRLFLMLLEVVWRKAEANAWILQCVYVNDLNPCFSHEKVVQKKLIVSHKTGSVLWAYHFRIECETPPSAPVWTLGPKPILHFRRQSLFDGRSTQIRWALNSNSCLPLPGHSQFCTLTTVPSVPSSTGLFPSGTVSTNKSFSPK